MTAAPVPPTSANGLRHDWRLEEAVSIHDAPLFELLDRARTIHQRFHRTDEVQLCTLLSVKTGGCPEDCAYCPQSSHYETEVGAERMLKSEEVVAAARKAKDAGATRFCMGAAWRQVKDGPAFDEVLTMVKGVKSLGLEACCTLGMLTDDQARRTQRSRSRCVQSQLGHVSRRISIDHHHAHLSRATRHAAEGPLRRHHGVLGWNHRDG